MGTHHHPGHAAERAVHRHLDLEQRCWTTRAGPPATRPDRATGLR